MNNIIAIASPYGQALYAHAKKYDLVTVYSALILTLIKCIKNHNIDSLLNSPKYRQDDIAELLIKVLSSVLDSYTKNFIRVLAINQHLPIIPLIHIYFSRCKEEDRKLKEAKITTACTVPISYVNKIKKKLEIKYHCNITMKIMVDPSIIGGAIIEIDDQVIDSSIKGNIDKLKRIIN